MAALESAESRMLVLVLTNYNNFANVNICNQLVVSLYFISSLLLRFWCLRKQIVKENGNKFFIYKKLLCEYYIT